MSSWSAINAAISEATGSTFTLQSTPLSISGGAINQCFLLESSEQAFFVKLNQPRLVSMFAAEYEGLLEIHRSHTIRTPEALCFGTTAHHSYLIMEYIPFSTRHVKYTELGQQLAAMHQVTHSQFGWHRDNTIGSTAQRNAQGSNWGEFWKIHRLQYQLDMTQRQSHGGRLQKLGKQLLSQIDILFKDYHPPASLLHGDLWSGNYSGTDDGTPVIFDPAVYYGDRETDLAMTELFGGYPAEFYAAYNEVYPLESGYEQRKPLYNLYHILNHVNLFGHGYIAQAESMMQQLLRDIN